MGCFQSYIHTDKEMVPFPDVLKVIIIQLGSEEGLQFLLLGIDHLTCEAL